MRRSVLEHKAFHAEKVMAMAAEAGIPEPDREQVVRYVGSQFKGLHEVNAIRFRLRPEDVADIARR